MGVVGDFAVWVVRVGEGVVWEGGGGEGGGLEGECWEGFGGGAGGEG